MKRTILPTAFVCLLATNALAENLPAHHHPRPPAPAPAPQVIAPKATANATGVGVGIANSSSQSGAVAISGQGGQGGQGGNSSSSLTVNNPANTTATVNSNVSGTTTSNINQSGTTTQNINQSGGTTNRVVSSGTTTVRTAPSMVAPGLAAAGLETCLGSASGTVSAIGFGIGGGSTYADEGCQARLDSRTLFAYGLKAAAVARLCQRADIWRSMPDMCAQYWPAGVPYPAGVVAVAPAEYQSGLPVKALMSASGGSIETIRVVNGKTGIEGDCLNYSHTKQKCYQWAGEPTVRRQRVANVQSPQRIVTKPKPKSIEPTAMPAQPKPPESPKPTEAPKADDKKS